MAQVVSTCFVMWTPIQFVTFSIIPATHRILFVSVAMMAWNTILDYMSHRAARAEHEAMKVVEASSDPELVLGIGTKI